MPVLIDLYCGGGGACAGYMRAGFHVVGVDIKPSPNYPGKFVQGDALATLATLVNWAGHWALGNGPVVGIHASPPCQGYTTMSNRWRGKDSKADQRTREIAKVRDALDATGLPYVIENVPGARAAMRNPVQLTGGMFGLQVHRPRLFEVKGFALPQPPKVAKPAGLVGVYGKRPDGRRLWTRKDGTELRCVSSVEQGRAAMGIAHSMVWRETADSIPPAYAEYVGRHLLAALDAQ